MTTLKDCIIETRCRKAGATGSTKRGAFWLACPPIIIRRYGGDGIGNSTADCTNFLELRHYRNGQMNAVIHGDYWHQNGAGDDDWTSVPGLLDCSTIEEVVVILKGVSFSDGAHVFSTRQTDTLAGALGTLGLVDAETSPDDVEDAS